MTTTRARPRQLALITGIALAGAASLLALRAAGQPSGSANQPPLAVPAAGANLQQIERGRYLAAAGDCVACHTLPRATPFSGGRPVETPFGVVLSANLTPDADTGIGRYDNDTFYRALHEGIDRNGHHLYPAFPYPYYTRVTREDSDSLLAYLRSLPPVNHAVDRNQLHFPFNIRALMAGWNLLYLDKGTFEQDKAQSAEWNRGAYLVEGLGHCQACHTPRNRLGGPEKDEAFRGGRFADWFAPDITPNRRTGIGAWGREAVLEFLRSGRNVHSGASGEMAEVVSFSTSRMTDADIHAVATYLASLRPSPMGTIAIPANAKMAQGEAVWTDNCAACHREDAKGVQRAFPPLASSANLQQRDPTTVLHYILAGAQHRPTDAAPTAFAMPAFAWKLDDAEIAAVATFVRNSWDNQASPVTTDQVADLRKRLAKSSDAAAPWPPEVKPAHDLTRPGSATWSKAGTDSRDNGTPHAGSPAP
ncbi:MAG: cytochrome c [Variovorax sp.]|nr:cytochrome c [Variovorax sp.]